jgi:hypothetical protein
MSPWRPPAHGSSIFASPQALCRGKEPGDDGCCAASVCRRVDPAQPLGRTARFVMPWQEPGAHVLRRPRNTRRISGEASKLRTKQRRCLRKSRRAAHLPCVGLSRHSCRLASAATAETDQTGGAAAAAGGDRSSLLGFAGANLPALVARALKRCTRLCSCRWTRRLAPPPPGSQLRARLPARWTVLVSYALVSPVYIVHAF